MTYWVPRPKPLLATALLAGAMLGASPAEAVPIVDVGANAGAALHWVGTPAIDVNAALNLRGVVIAGEYWKQLTGANQYLQAGVRYNVSPVPMLMVSPGLGVVSANGAFGPLVNVTGSFSPVLLPLSIEAAAGAAYESGQALLPYHAGIKFSPLPFVALGVAYRGWAGQATPMAGLAGPEIGIEIGI